MEYSINSCYENRRIFVEEFNIGFKTPKSDARDCQTFDKLKIQIKEAEVTRNKGKLKFLKQERQLH